MASNLNSPNLNSKRDPILGEGVKQGSIKNTSAGKIKSIDGPSIPNAKGNPLAPSKGLRVI